jgi:hypothetical protein
LAGPIGAQPQPSGSPTSSGRYLPAGWRLCGEAARPARTDYDERHPCTTCHGTGLITAASVAAAALVLRPARHLTDQVCVRRGQ